MGLVFFIIVVALIFGLILDAIRNGIIEGILDEIEGKKYLKRIKAKPVKGVENNEGKINWDFFFNSNKKSIATLCNKYYNYYLFDINSISSMVLSLPFVIFFMILYNYCYVVPIVVLILIAMVLAKDALDLRWEIYLHTNKIITKDDKEETTTL